MLIDNKKVNKDTDSLEIIEDITAQTIKLVAEYLSMIDYQYLGLTTKENDEQGIFVANSKKEFIDMTSVREHYLNKKYLLR